MPYKSFNTQTGKLRKNWEQQQFNSSDIHNTIRTIDTSFLSQTNYKIPTQISLIENETIPQSGGFSQNLYTFSFSNFPDWAVDQSQLGIFFYLDSAYDLLNEVSSFSAAFSAGTLKVGDIDIVDTATRQHHWWIKKSDTVWQLNIDIKLNIRVASSVTEFGFITSALSVYSNVILYIFNERNYDTIQSSST